MKKTINLYKALTVSSSLGFLAAFLQMLEKLNLLANPEAKLFCNLNAVFSCNNILEAWQSSVFGFPNALMCVIFFVIMLTAGIVGWSGGQISKTTRLVFQGMGLFFVGFGFWYLWQSIFAVGSMCIYCIGCYCGVLVLSWAWLRLNHQDWPISQKASKALSRLISKNYDILIWLAIAIAIVLELVIKFA